MDTSTPRTTRQARASLARELERLPRGVNYSFPQYDELYNNTCYNEGNCARFASDGATVRAANSSYAQNNLIYSASAISNTGTANTVSNNSTSTTANPGFKNQSGSSTGITDFKPTANYSGGTSVPNILDALGVPWGSTWDLGAMHH